MRPWSDQQLKSIRHLAAARFFLPVKLEQPEFPETESDYLSFLHHSEFGLALDMLEALGEWNRGHAEEPLFWSELILAAENMNRTEQAEKYRAYLREAEASAKADT